MIRTPLNTSEINEYFKKPFESEWFPFVLPDAVPEKKREREDIKIIMIAESAYRTKTAAEAGIPGTFPSLRNKISPEYSDETAAPSETPLQTITNEQIGRGKKVNPERKMSPAQITELHEI